MRAEPTQVDVLIAGAGPCGLMLALELAIRGVRALTVDPKATTAFNPQANATQARTMEHYRRLGLADAIRSLGLPPDHPTDIAYFTRLNKHELARLKLPTSAQARAAIRRMGGSWSAAELPHRISQKYVEAELHRALRARAPQSIRFGWQLDSFNAHAEGVEARICAVDGSAIESVQARYLIGADGPRSPVRGHLGIRYGGETGTTRNFMGGKMFAVYVRSPALYARLPHARAWMYVTVNAERRALLASVNGVDEFAFHAAVHAHENADHWGEAEARQVLAQAFGEALEFEMLSCAVWTAGHALVAQSFGQGRVMIAGDAAHLFTPTGGLGYNTAVGDAVNLAWKLASVLRGPSSHCLLETYEAERLPTAQRNTGYARRFADSVGLIATPPEFEEESAAGQAARALVGDQLDAHVKLEFNIPGVTFGERYDASPIVYSDPAHIPPDNANSYTPSLNPGGRVPHVWLDDTTSLYDQLGFDWTLISFGAHTERVHEFSQEARRLGVSLTLLELSSSEHAAQYQHALLLIRPDQMIAWTSLVATTDSAAQVLRRVAAIDS